MITCPSCGVENPADKRFCGDCGSPLAVVCGTCGGESAPGKKFCGECGAPLGARAPAAVAVPASERRLVSVLFADLVGFTTLSEARDAEDVRELLSRYFETCQRLIDRYGGIVEKFIGDAVMAVWGSPVAREDDAERAVRAALELTAAIEALGAEIAAPELAARAGVHTGEAAVTLGASGQGMVAGDLVNTASRIQSVAEPGTVLVGDATKRSCEAAIAFEEAGEHELKGKSDAVRLWRATRVTANVGGARKSDVFEPPFVGRDRELRLVKETYHAAAEERKAHLVSVVGIAGIGKSRLGWELEKYLDGLLGQLWWHRGRCLAYGEGVAYWALAEMVRMRAGISEDETAESAREKLRESVAAHVPDADEREWLEPRLGHLLGLAERTAHDREDLFSAWRLFFERLADVNPTVLVFEDLQWADPGLLDFIDYLLEWSRNHPIFVLALTRPELHEKRAGWGAATRNSSTLLLEPLSPAAMEQLLDGLVPGLPDDLRAQILQRAEGVPLYAVETLRMLLDRGLLERRGDTFAVTGSVAALEVPETLHALIAARLDGLGPDERRLLQDASVLGKSFTREGVTSLSGLDRNEVERLLSSLTRKEILTLQADPRSPERGQYVFLQDLLKRVAYETQAKKDRKARHLAAAAHLEQATGSAEQEAVAVVAAHYLDAHRAAPDAEDAPAIKAKAAACLAQAGERAQALAATEEARNYLEQAAELTDDGLQRAGLLERAGLAATDVGPFADAVRLFAQAVELYRDEGEVHAAARAAAWQGFSTWQGGDLEGGSTLLEESLETVADEEPDADLAELAEVRARLRFFLGDVEGASTRVERALEIAEALYVPGVLVDALNTKHLVLSASGREEEALALLQRAIELGRQHDLGHRLLRALYNLSYQMTVRDDNRAAVQIDLECLEIARRRGDRVSEMMANGHLGYAYYALGDWDEVDRILAELDSSNVDRSVLDRLGIGIPLLVGRGDLAEARRLLEESESSRTSGELQQRAGYLLSQGWLLTADGRPAEGLAAFREALALEDRLQPRHPFTKYTLIGALQAALAVPDLDAASELLDLWEAMRPVDRTPLLEAHWERARAALAMARGDADSAEPSLAKALEIFRRLEMPYDVGTSLVAQAEWLVGRDREAEAEPLLAEAREIFQRLRARPMLERLAALESRGAAVSA